jgi:predicted Rossmann fold flavoprotein
MGRVVVIGAGAAGSMAAIFAASAGAETLILERTSGGGHKILLSGGGRCNLLPARTDESRFVTDSSRNTLAKIVRTWPLHEQVAFFERDVGIPLAEEEESGRLFPASHSAGDVRDGLLTLARRKGATLHDGVTVTGLSPSGGVWRVEKAGGAPLKADAVVVATGGLSLPETGSDGLGLRLLEDLGHSRCPTYPALTTLLAEPNRFRHLAGVSLPVTLAVRAQKRTATATGGFLFTHRGYSGPVVLDVSHVAVRSLMSDPSPARVFVSWSELGDEEWAEALSPQGPRSVAGVLRKELPGRLATSLLAEARIPVDQPVSNLRRGNRLRLIDTLVRFPLPWTGHGGYEAAEVTGGGIALSEIDPATMESRRHRGLFLCGELLDAFGPIGGYNFLWAWVTGRAAGLGAGAR